eukprot:517123-Pyramimonas_sp.AAC.1
MRCGAEAVGPDVLLATLSLGIVRLKTGCCLNGLEGSCVHGYGFGIYPMVDVPLLIFRAPQVACTIGNSLLVERVLHAAGPRTIH